MKEWKYFEYEQCPRCESDLEVYSSEPVDGEEIWVHKMYRVGGRRR
jgi:hypothetical protein